MKILLTSDWYIPAVNGVVTSVLNLKKGLEERGHEVRVLTLSQTPRSFSKDNVTYIGSIPAGIIYPGARLRAAYGRKLIRELIDWKPDIVHSNCEFSTFWLARRIAERLDIPLVHTYHTVYENYTHYISHSQKWGSGMVKTLSCHIATQIDCFIAPTEKVKKLLENYHVSKPVYVVPTGIEQKQFVKNLRKSDREEIRKKFNIPEENTVLVSVGRLAKEKNCTELLQAVSHLKNSPITLLFVGDGPCFHELEQQTKTLGLEGKVIFSGMVSPKEIRRYYHAGDLFVSASTSETQGLTYIEALASGLPLLCRRDECLEGVLTDDVNGWTYETLTEFSDKLDWFLKHPQYRENFKQAAEKVGGRFSVAAFAQQAERIYREQIVLHYPMRQGIIA